MRLLALLPLLTGGCAYLSRDLGGQEGEDLVETGQVDSGDTADTDTGSDSDTDEPDSGTDSADTAADVGFTGIFLVDAADTSGATDRCAGTIELRREGDALTGAASCVFAGPLATAYPDGLGGTVDGTVATDPVSGTVHFTIGATGDLAWTGTASDLVVTGSFAGPLGGLTVSGSFDAARE